ncbi:MAG: DUF2752 domain-containing protein [Acidobacteria bacterium]|nr:DUF2752 domain-containing protein [Acidobacteriota bacterium]
MPERWILLVVPVLLATARWLPLDRLEFPLCPVRAMTGLPCPSCGFTRAGSLLLRGEWSAAIALQPFGVAIPLALAALWCAAGLICLAPVSRRTSYRFHLGRFFRNERAVGALFIVLAALSWTWNLTHMLRQELLVGRVQDSALGRLFDLISSG